MNRSIIFGLVLAAFAAGAGVQLVFCEVFAPKPKPAAALVVETPNVNEDELSRALLLLNRSFDHDKPANISLGCPNGETMRVAITWEKTGGAK
jgi:hypothetical protein